VHQAAEAAVTAVDWALSPLVGISQIFVVQNALSGALILGGIAVYSKEAAAHTLLGSSIGAPPARTCSLATHFLIQI
jgi:urea transporter